MAGVFFAIGLILLTGFAGNLLFDKTRIPESLFLMLIGILIGPVLGMVDQSQLMQFSSTFATIAMVIVLMEGGINLDFFGIIRSINEAGAFTLLSTSLSVATSFAILSALGYSAVHALLFSIAIGGTTSITVIHLMEKMRLPERVKDILLVESMLTDVFLITAAVLAVQFIRTSSLGISDIVSAILSQVSIAFLLGFFAALGWSYFLAVLKKRELLYVSTLGLAFVLYDFVEYSGGNGPIAVLVFSLFLGNITRLANQLKRKTVFSEIKESLIRSIKSLEREFSFFIKTFFFVYIGMLVNPSGIGPGLLLLSGILVSGMLVSRFAAAWLFSFVEPEFKGRVQAIASAIPRGFSSILITILLMDAGIRIEGMANAVVAIVFLSTLVPMLSMRLSPKSRRP